MKDYKHLSTHNRDQDDHPTTAEMIVAGLITFCGGLVTLGAVYALMWYALMQATGGV